MDQQSLTRRDLLASLAALGAGAIMTRGRLTAQTPGGATRRIDVHHHFANAELIKLMADKRTAGWQTWTPYSGKDSSPSRGRYYMVMVVAVA